MRESRVLGLAVAISVAVAPSEARAQHDVVRPEDHEAARSTPTAAPTSGAYANALRLARMLNDNRLVATLLAGSALVPGAEPADVASAVEALEALGEPERAERLLEERLRRSPDEMATRLQLAELLDRVGDAKGALAAWRGVESHLPITDMTSTQALAYARAFSRCGDTDGAYRVLKTARPKANADEREFWEDLATLAWQLDDAPEALIAYRVIRAKHYHVPGAGQRLVALAIEAGSTDEAIAAGVEDFRATGEADSLLSAAELQSRSGDWEAVDRLLALGQQNMRTFAKNEAYWLMRAETSAALLDSKGATEAYRVALALDPGSVDAQAALLWDAIDRNDDAALRQYVPAWRASAATNPALWSAYAVGLDRIGRTSEAIGFYERQLHAEPNDPLLALELADALKRVGDNTRAMRLRRFAAVKLRRFATDALRGRQLTEQEQQLVQFEATTARDLGGAELGERWFRALRKTKSADVPDAESFRIEWYLADDRFDDARRSLLHAHQDRLRQPRLREYRLALALADDDYDTIHQILTDSRGVDTEQRIDALVELGRDDLATTAIRQALAHDPASDHPEWQEKLAEIHYRHAPTWTLGGAYEYTTGLDTFGPEIAAAHDLGGARVFVSGYGRRMGVRNGSLILDAPTEEAGASMLARFSSQSAVTEIGAAGNAQPAHDGNRTTPLPSASFFDERQWTSQLGTIVQLVADDCIEDTGLLRLTGARSQLDLGIRDDIGSSWYVSADVHAREDHSREFHYLASELGQEVEAGYKLRTRAPEWDFGVQGLAHQRWNVDHLPSDVAGFVPTGADLALYLPPSFQLVSVVMHLTRGDFSDRYRPDRSSFPRYECDAAAGILFPDRDGAVHVQCSLSALTPLGGYVSATAFYNRGIAGIGSQTTAESALSYSQTF